MPQELPPHPDETVFTWTSRELAAITRYGEACAALARREALEQAAKACLSVGTGGIVYAAAIRALAPDTIKEG